ncbi:MAG: hypothetical protein J6Q83_04855 [Clostridia bacterium]|nr:hypothetical protein [Clostridia bacterium]
MENKKNLLGEMREEARRRLEVLNVPSKAIEIFEKGNIPVTVFSSEIESELSSLHKKVLDRFNKDITGEKLPFYITESWHGCDIISVLYIGEYMDEWEFEREEAEEGYHLIYAYNVDNPDESEVGSGVFSIEDGVLWRVS